MQCLAPTRRSVWHLAVCGTPPSGTSGGRICSLWRAGYAALKKCHLGPIVGSVSSSLRFDPFAFLQVAESALHGALSQTGSLTNSCYRGEAVGAIWVGVLCQTQQNMEAAGLAWPVAVNHLHQLPTHAATSKPSDLRSRARFCFFKNSTAIR